MKAPNFYLADLHLWPPAPAAGKGNLVCSEKVQFAPQSRNCEVEGELARDKTSSIFTVEEKVAVFERGKLIQSFEKFNDDVDCVGHHSLRAGRKKSLDRNSPKKPRCILPRHDALRCKKKCTWYKSNSENNLLLSQSSFQVNCLAFCILVLEFSIFLHLAK